MRSTTVHIPLTPLDHAPPGNYSCSLSYLPLKHGVSPAQAFEILREGLHRTFVQLPWLSGRVWPQSPDTPGYRPGQLEIRHDAVDVDGPRPYQIRFNQPESPADFDELKEAAFPTETFPDESVIWAPFLPDINSGPEVLVAQANFIPGACVLTAGMYHSACDGVGGVAIFKLWADHCRALQSDSPPPPPPGPESSDRGLLERIWATEGARKPVESIDPGTWRLLGLAPPVVPEHPPNGHAAHGPEPGEARVLKSAVFYVPPAKFAALQRECAQDGAAISGTDAIVALIWRCALKARRAAARAGEISNPDAVACLAVTVDGRPYFSRSLPATYLGNLTCINLSAMALSRLAAPDTRLATVARTIRDGANAISTASLLDAYALARSVPDYGQLTLQSSSLDSAAMLVSPLLGYPTSSVSFGDAVFAGGGVIEALRVPMLSFNRTTRLSLVLPKLPAGGVEFLLNLFEEEMDLLLRDAEFREYALFLTN